MVNQFAGDRDIVFIQGNQTSGAPPITILDYYSLGGVSKWAWFGIEVGFFVVFFFFSYLALAFVRHVKR